MPEDKNHNITLDDLAIMVARGFDNTATKTDVDSLKTDVDELKIDMRVVKKDIAEIKLELSDANKKIDRLEVRVEDVHDLVIGLEQGPILDLQQRIQMLEKTAKVS